MGLALPASKHGFDMFVVCVSVRKFAQDRISPLSRVMDEKAEMPDSLIEAVFANGVNFLSCPHDQSSWVLDWK